MDSFGTYIAGLDAEHHAFAVDFLRRVADQLETKAAGLSREKWAAIKGAVIVLRQTANDMEAIVEMRAELLAADRPPVRVISLE